MVQKMVQNMVQNMVQHCSKWFKVSQRIYENDGDVRNKLYRLYLYIIAN